MAEVTPRRGGRLGTIAFAVIIAIAIAVLAGLGTWQVQRAHWKTALLAELDARETAPPLDIFDADGLTADDLRFRRVTATGRLLPRAARLHHVQDGVLGYKAVLPFMLEGAEGTILVDAGFVRAQMEGAMRIEAPSRPIEIAGYARFHEGRPSRFTPDNVPEENRWYWWDMPALAAALKLDADLRPMSIQLSEPAEGLAVGGMTPVPTGSLPRPHNRHAGYAVTWFGLALVVAGALAVWIWQRRRRAVNPPQSAA